MGNEVPNRDLVKRARRVGALVVFLAAAVVLAAAFLVARDHSASVVAGTFDVGANLPLTAAAGAMFVVFFLLLGASWFLVRSLAAADVAAVEISRLADVARKTDHAVFFTDAEGNIGWVIISR